MSLAQVQGKNSIGTHDIIEYIPYNTTVVYTCWLYLDTAVRVYFPPVMMVKDPSWIEHADL